MKWKAVIVLVAIAVGIAAPPSLPLSAVGGGAAEIGVLDLCHAGTPALSSNVDMPCMHECPCRPVPPAQNSAPEIVTPCKPLFIAYQDERPPEV